MLKYMLNVKSSQEGGVTNGHWKQMKDHYILNLTPFFYETDRIQNGDASMLKFI